MGWLISDTEYKQLRHSIAWGGCGGSTGPLQTVLDRAIEVEIVDVHERPMKWTRVVEEESKDEPSDEG